jgi:nicotinamide-nucleotide amidase
VARLLGADVGLAVTGVGGPDPSDGQPPGTVWIAVHHAGTTDTRLWVFDGTPPEVVLAACTAVLQLANAVLSDARRPRAQARRR